MHFQPLQIIITGVGWFLCDLLSYNFGYTLLTKSHNLEMDYSSQTYLYQLQQLNKCHKEAISGENCKKVICGDSSSLAVIIYFVDCPLTLHILPNPPGWRHTPWELFIQCLQPVQKALPQNSISYIFFTSSSCSGPPTEPVVLKLVNTQSSIQIIYVYSYFFIQPFNKREAKM